MKTLGLVNRVALWVLLAVVSIAACGVSEEAIRTQLAAACDGVGAPDAAIREAGAVGVAYVKVEPTFEEAASTQSSTSAEVYPAVGALEGELTEASVVICLEATDLTETTSCEYDDGSRVVRYEAIQDIAVREAATGALLAEGQLPSEVPGTCRGSNFDGDSRSIWLPAEEQLLALVPAMDGSGSAFPTTTLATSTTSSLVGPEPESFDSVADMRTVFEEAGYDCSSWQPIPGAFGPKDKAFCTGRITFAIYSDIADAPPREVEGSDLFGPNWRISCGSASRPSCGELVAVFGGELVTVEAP